MTLAREPYLSVVAAYGGPEIITESERLLALFVSTLANQARRFGLPLEVVLVDWRPGDRRPSLESLPLAWPVSDALFSLSVIRVEDADLADSPHAVDRGFQERIAQNIGIRRARGRFVLAATLETILSDEHVAALARMDLPPDLVPVPLRLTVDGRTDLIRSSLASPLDHDAVLEACLAATFSVSCYPRYALLTAADLGGDRTLEQILDGFRARHPDLREPDPTYGAVSYLLMAREHWSAFRGFPEWPVVDQLLDRLVLSLARLSELSVRLLPFEQCYFHLGWLRPRLAERPFPVRGSADRGGLTIERPSEPLGSFHEGQMMALIADLGARMERLGAPVYYNPPDWGLAGRELATFMPGARGG